MPFPVAPRVIYRRNPLDNVISQVRFTPILRIDSEPPAQFQERIRDRFPQYRQKLEVTSEITLPPDGQFTLDPFGVATNRGKQLNHEFISEDGVWKLNLTRTFLSLSCSKYSRWEEFYQLYKNAVDAVVDVYKVPYFTRVGLRYVDIFKRSALGLETEPWSELLNSHLLGLVSSDASDNIKSFETSYEVDLNDTNVARISSSFVQSTSENEICFMLDSDFFALKRLPIDGLGSLLGSLHDHATNLIQWSVTKKLHEAMQPETLIP